MPAPKRYKRGYSFSGYQATNPSKPLPGPALDNELENVEQSVGQIITNLGLIQRSDGALRNGIVGNDQLAPDLQTGVNPATEWATGISYAVGDTVFADVAYYRCIIGHISTVFADDLAAGYWLKTADFEPIVADAIAAREDAEAAATAAASSASTATGAASSASGSASAAADDAAATAGDATATAADRAAIEALIDDATQLATPGDGTVTDAKVAVGANIAVSKLDLSDAVTWTGEHVFAGGIQISGEPPMETTFIGSGLPAKFHVSLNADAGEALMPDICAQFCMDSDIGFAGGHLAYKIGLFASCLGTANSAPVYAINSVAMGYAGTGGYLVTGIESDINQMGVDANVVGADTSAYGFVAVSAGSNNSSAAYWVARSTAQWNYAFAATNDSVTGATILDTTNSGTSVLILGTHNTGIDLSGGGFTTSAISLPNGAPIKQKTTGGTSVDILALNGANNLVLSNGANAVVVSAPYIHPAVDNSTSCGAPTLRWDTVFANTGMINTSDLRLKLDRATLEPAKALAVIRAVADDPDGLITFRWEEGGTETVELEIEDLVPEIEVVEQPVDTFEEQPDGSVKLVVKIERLERPSHDDVSVLDENGQQVMRTRKTKAGEETYPLTYAKPRMVPGKIKKQVTRSKPGKRRHAGSGAQVWKRVLESHGLDLGLVVQDDPGDPESRLSLRPDQMIPFLHAALIETDKRLTSALDAIETLEGKVAMLAGTR